MLFVLLVLLLVYAALMSAPSSWAARLAATRSMGSHVAAHRGHAGGPGKPAHR